MLKLLKANLSRLFKSGVFRLAEFVAVGYPVFILVVKYFESEKSGESGDYIMDTVPLMLSMFLPFIMAVVVGLYVGTEYHDGTMRNKIIVGHNRGTIYLANLLTAFITDAVVFISSAATGTVLGTFLFKAPSFSFATYAKAIGVLTLAGCAFSAIYMAISMCVQSKATGVVTVMILSIALFMTSMTMYYQLQEPEYNEAYSYVSEATGETIEHPRSKNPRYLEGTKRKVYQTVFELIPYTQTITVTNSVKLPEKPYKYPLCSCGWIVVSTAVGMFIFKKRNLK